MVNSPLTHTSNYEHAILISSSSDRVRPHAKSEMKCLDIFVQELHSRKKENDDTSKPIRDENELCSICYAEVHCLNNSPRQFPPPHSTSTPHRQSTLHFSPANTSHARGASKGICCRARHVSFVKLLSRLLNPSNEALGFIKPQISAWLFMATQPAIVGGDASQRQQ